jgi:hypothetical protein
MLPLSASSLLADWSEGRTGSFDAARARLIDAVRAPEQIPRFQRALPILLASVPILLLVAGSVVALQTVRAFADSDNIHVVRLLSVIPDSPPETRTALEIYLAGRYRTKLADDGFWNSLVMRGNLAELREPARQLLAAHPVVSEADMERVAPVVEPELARAESWYDDTVRPGLALAGSTIVAALAGVALIFVVISTIVSNVIVRGGVVFRLLGLAVVTRTGRQAGRARSILRVLVAWSPALIWMVSLGTSPVDRITAGQTSTVVGLGVALSVMAFGSAWSIFNRHRGPHDWISGTRVVPR